MGAAGHPARAAGTRLVRALGLSVWRIRSGASPARVEAILPPGRGVYWWEWVGTDPGHLMPLWRALGVEAPRIAELMADRWDTTAGAPGRWLSWPVAATGERVRIFCAPGMVLTATANPDLLSDWRQRLARPLPRWSAGSDGVLCLLLQELTRASSRGVEDLERRTRWLEERRAASLDGAELETCVGLNREILAAAHRLSEQRALVGHLASRPPGSAPEERQRTLEQMFRHLDLMVHRLDSLRELVHGSLEAQLSLLQVQTNDVIRTLTVIATVLAPATLVTGIYGMNFRIPETSWPFGYFFALGLMALTSVGMLVHFRRRGWL